MNTDTRSDSELNRIIAEWMGWKWVISREHFLKGRLTGYPPTTSGLLAEAPKYCTDLNSITEAVRKLGGDDQSLWYDTLAMECPEDPEADIAQMRWITQWFVAVEATARQRAEALVYVIESTKK